MLTKEIIEEKWQIEAGKPLWAFRTLVFPGPTPFKNQPLPGMIGVTNPGPLFLEEGWSQGHLQQTLCFLANEMVKPLSSGAYLLIARSFHHKIFILNC